MIDLDERVEIAPHAFKRLGDCTRADLKCAAELSHRRSQHAKAQAEALASGHTPACDWMKSDGQFCSQPAAWVQPTEVGLVCLGHGGEAA